MCWTSLPNWFQHECNTWKRVRPCETCCTLCQREMFPFNWASGQQYIRTFRWRLSTQSRARLGPRSSARTFHRQKYDKNRNGWRGSFILTEWTNWPPWELGTRLAGIYRDFRGKLLWPRWQSSVSLREVFFCGVFSRAAGKKCLRPSIKVPKKVPTFIWQ